MSLTIRELREQDYAYFNSIKERQDREKQIGSAKYIEFLGVATSTDVSDLPIAMFFNSTGNRLYLERNRLNEIYMKWLHERGPKAAVTTKLSDEDLKKIETMVPVLGEVLAGDTQSQVHHLERSIRSNHDQANNYLRSYHQQLQNINTLTQQLHTLKLRPQVVADGKQQILEVLKDPFWTLDPRPSPRRTLSFISGPVTLTQIMKAHGVNTVVPMGRFRATLLIADTGTPAVHVMPYEGNPITEGGCYHPHITYRGMVCFGNLGPAYVRALNSGKLREAMNVLKTVLHAYNDGDCYVTLPEFDQAHKAGDLFEWPLYAVPVGGDLHVYMHDDEFRRRWDRIHSNTTDPKITIHMPEGEADAYSTNDEPEDDEEDLDNHWENDDSEEGLS